MDKTLGEQQKKKKLNKNPILTSHFAFVKSIAPAHTSYKHTDADAGKCANNAI